MVTRQTIETVGLFLGSFEEREEQEDTMWVS
jgi:hypothetical protein